MQTTAVSQSPNTTNTIPSSFIQKLINGPGDIYRFINSSIEKEQGVTYKIYNIAYGAANIAVSLETILYDGLRSDTFFSKTYPSALFVLGAVGYKTLHLRSSSASSINSFLEANPSLTYLWLTLDSAAENYFFLFDVMYQALLVNVRPIPEFAFCFAVGTLIYAAIDNYSKGLETKKANPLDPQQITLLKKIGDTLILAAQITSRASALKRAFTPEGNLANLGLATFALISLSYAIGKCLEETQPITAQQKKSLPSDQKLGRFGTTIGRISETARSLFTHVEKLRKENSLIEGGLIFLNRAARISVYGSDALILPVLMIFAAEAKNKVYLTVGLIGLGYGLAEAYVNASNIQAEANGQIKKEKTE